MCPSQSVPLSHDCCLASPDKHVDQSITAPVTVTQDKKETGIKLATNVTMRLWPTVYYMVESLISCLSSDFNCLCFDCGRKCQDPLHVTGTQQLPMPFSLLASGWRCEASEVATSQLCCHLSHLLSRESLQECPFGLGTGQSGPSPPVLGWTLHCGAAAHCPWMKVVISFV